MTTLVRIAGVSWANINITHLGLCNIADVANTLAAITASEKRHHACTVIF